MVVAEHVEAVHSIEEDHHEVAGELVACCDQTVVGFGIEGEVAAEVAEDHIAEVEVEVGRPVERSSDDSWKRLMEQHVRCEEGRVENEPLEVDHGVVEDRAVQSAIAVDHSHCVEGLAAEVAEGELEGLCMEPDFAGGFEDILVADLVPVGDHCSLAVADEGRGMDENRPDLLEFHLDHLEEVLHRAAAGTVQEEVAHTRTEAVAVDDVGEGQEAEVVEGSCIAEQPSRTRCEVCRQQAQ